MPDQPDVRGILRRVLHMVEDGGRTQSDMRREFRWPGQSRSHADNMLWNLLKQLHASGFVAHAHRFWCITPLGRQALANARARKAAQETAQ